MLDLLFSILVSGERQMRGRNRREVLAPLLRLGERFAVWRRDRAGGERIPKSL